MGVRLEAACTRAEWGEKSDLQFDASPRLGEGDYIVYVTSMLCMAVEMERGTRDYGPMRLNAVRRVSSGGIDRMVPNKDPTCKVSCASCMTWVDS